MSARSSLLPPVSRRARHVLARRVQSLRRGERELPTYFVVGAKRAGTTSLDEYIVDHPLVLRGLVEKGCRYYDVNYGRGPAWFRSHLPLVADVDRRTRRLGGRPIVGESSPYYSFHPDAARRIADDVPDARLLFVLRDPVQRAWSHYRYEVARGFETLGPLEALAAEADRLAGLDLAADDPAPLDDSTLAFAHRHFSYLSRSRYAAQLARLHRHFAPEQVLVLKSESLFAEPDATMGRVFEHLGLPAHRGREHRAHKALGDASVPADFRAAVESAVSDDLLALTELAPGIGWA
ncbi:sulfotransferase family protein [Nocardioides sp. GXZ039]|uniref:sulfotransferase family protein n=1 Tax=Nocardioides sp. GXZ039 TaxID=3136018 RepID=UPI0030F48AC6